MTTGAGSGRGLVAGALLALVLVGCADAPTTPPSAPPPPPPPPAAPTFTVPPPVSVPQPTVVIATDGPRSWTMPDLVGKNLQAAQDAIQELTGFEIPVTISHDATGAGREQLLDRNWTVCSQNIPPGESISRSTRIDFGAVRTDETC